MTLLFDSRVLWHSLTFTVRFLKVLLSHFEYRANLSAPSATLSNASNQEARRVAVPEFASWIPRRPPPLFPNATLLIAVEKLYIEEKREANTNSPIQATYILMWGPTRLLHGSIVAWLQVLTSWSSGPVCRPFYLGKLLDATIWSCTIECRTQLLHDGSAPHGTVQQPCPHRNCLFDAVGTCQHLNVLHFFGSSFIISDGRSVVDSVDCCLLFKLSTQLEIEVLQLLHSIHFALTLIYPVAT